MLNVSNEKSSVPVAVYGSEPNGTTSQKRKRQAWSVKENLAATENYEKSNSKHSTAKAIGCTRSQLSNWIKKKEELKNLRSSKQGNKRKKLKSGGKKLKYADFNDHLIRWFKERRTPPTPVVAVNKVQHERISFKQLLR
ncbi:hypothetical protein I4U23_000080 [Adineta vaga]|nr:hypothetical protein I4U23_000080 [Adineta vaga]